MERNQGRNSKQDIEQKAWRKTVNGCIQGSCSDFFLIQLTSTYLEMVALSGIDSFTSIATDHYDLDNFYLRLSDDSGLCQVGS